MINEEEYLREYLTELKYLTELIEVEIQASKSLDDLKEVICQASQCKKLFPERDCDVCRSNLDFKYIQKLIDNHSKLVEKHVNLCFKFAPIWYNPPLKFEELKEDSVYWFKGGKLIEIEVEQINAIIGEPIDLGPEVERMKEKELCEMCNDYSSDNICEHKDKCKLLQIIKENNELKEENKRLKEEIDEVRNKMSYMIDPNSIGYNRGGEMGW